MFGATLDYYLLRRLAHRRNLATEEALDARFREASPLSCSEATMKSRKLIDRFGGHFPRDSGSHYLDMGCGSGELTVALAEQGLGHMTGVDILPRNIERARAHARQSDAGKGVRFVCGDLRTWVPAEKFHVLLSFDAFEHLDEPGEFLRVMHRFVIPGGAAVLAFGPLFHSPFGDHMWDFFRMQIPWRGVLFSEQAVLRVREEFFRPTDPAGSYRQIAGGLNQMRYSEFLGYVHAAGWTFEYLSVNSFLNALPPLRLVSDSVMRIPGMRDYFAHNVYAVLRAAV